MQLCGIHLGKVWVLRRVVGVGNSKSRVEGAPCRHLPAANMMSGVWTLLGLLDRPGCHSSETPAGERAHLSNSSLTDGVGGPF